MAIGSLHTLVHHPRPLGGDSVHLPKAQILFSPFLLQKTVLIPAADGHKLGKQLLCRLLIKLPVSQFPHRGDLRLLSAFIKDLLSCLDLKFRHLTYQSHSLLKQPDNFRVNYIQLVSDL